MKQPLRVAVIGAGMMGRHHATAIKRLGERARLVAVVDGDAAQARRQAESLGVPGWYESASVMLAAESPDVVHVCTPPASHGEIARMSLEGGANVYLEKPFTETSEEARRIFELAHRTGKRVCAGHQLLVAPPTLEAEAMLRRIGTIHHVESYFAFKPTRPANGRPPRTPLAQLLDILPHPTYLLLHFMNTAASSALATSMSVRVDDGGDVFAMLAQGDVTGLLTVTLRGRPADSWVRIVGSRGTLRLDYIRDIVLPSLGVGSAIEKIIDPYQRAWRLALGTTSALGGRVLRRQLSYPGLFEMFDRFYGTLAAGAPSPTSPESVMRTVEACERIEHAIRSRIPEIPATSGSRPTVVVTGGTGLLGKAVVRRLLRQGETPLVLTRRTPPPSERIIGAQYRAADLGSGIIPLPSSASVVIHCAAETVGGWDAHQRNSIDATRHLLHGMHAAGIRRLVHVSSLAVIDAKARQPLSEASPLEKDGRRRGAYVWGKLEAERVAADAPRTHDIAVHIARPGALISSEGYEPPGKLGRAIGGTYVAVGRKASTIPVCDVELAASVLVWMAMRFEDAPPLLNVVDETPPERRALVDRIIEQRPGTRVVWIPAPVLGLMSVAATVLQKVARPKKAAVSVWSAFDAPRVDTANLRAAMLAVRSTSRVTMREGSRA